MTLALLIQPLVWIITDPRPLKERIGSYFRLKSILFFLAEILLILTTLVSTIYFPWPKTSFETPILFSGLTFFSLGLFIAIWAKITMKAAWGLPGEHDSKRQKKVITGGPFQFTRNPIYVGIIMMLLGYTVTLKSYTLFLVPLIALYFYKAVLKEEKILSKHFGRDYEKYKSKVPRFL